MKLCSLFWGFSLLICVSGTYQSNIIVLNQTERSGNVESMNDIVPIWKENVLKQESENKNRVQSNYKPNLARRDAIGGNNLRHYEHKTKVFNTQRKRQLRLRDYVPGKVVKPFSILALDGEYKLSPLEYPGPVINYSTPIIIHGFNPDSGFLECLWNCTSSVEGLFLIRSPRNATKFDTHFIFLSHNDDAYTDALWMRNRIVETGQRLYESGNITKATFDSVLSTVHFGVQPLHELGNWIPGVLEQWTCLDHNCGLDQVVIKLTLSQQGLPTILSRLDARYDWLPSATSTFRNKTFELNFVSDGCKNVTGVKGKIVYMFDNGTCSHFNQVSNMSASGAAGVLFLTAEHVKDLTCEGAECDTELTIPASSVKYDADSDLLSLQNALNYTVQYQNTPSDNFFLGIESGGKLSEVGWFLYPSFDFLGWQAQWYNYAVNLQEKLSKPVRLVHVLNSTVMKGSKGAVGSITMPADLMSYKTIELDMSLSCPGTRDETCPPWDHTVQLYVCCQPDSPLCNMELGRWITPFRRRIGRWISDISDLVSLMNASAQCTFTIKTAAWAQPWVVSLQLRLSDPLKSAQRQEAVIPFKTGDITFDKNYNTHFTPYQFKVPENVNKVYVVWRITGHGSDENGCGEFCVTSHHFVINNKWNNVTFDNPNNPLGCTLPVAQYGTVPNEHGTWLYGRDGWCDGQDVPVHVTDITTQVTTSGTNTLRYLGFFEGKDPDPKHNPGLMVHYAYLVFVHDNVSSGLH